MPESFKYMSYAIEVIFLATNQTVFYHLARPVDCIETRSWCVAQGSEGVETDLIA